MKKRMRKKLEKKVELGLAKPILNTVVDKYRYELGRMGVDNEILSECNNKKDILQLKTYVKELGIDSYKVVYELRDLGVDKVTLNKCERKSDYLQLKGYVDKLGADTMNLIMNGRRWNMSSVKTRKKALTQISQYNRKYRDGSLMADVDKKLLAIEGNRDDIEWLVKSNESKVLTLLGYEDPGDALDRITGKGFQGKDKDWTETDKERIAHYNKLLTNRLIKDGVLMPGESLASNHTYGVKMHISFVKSIVQEGYDGKLVHDNQLVDFMSSSISKLNPFSSETTSL